VINGVHSVIFSKDADADRAFFRDVLNLESVDAGGGWLIFALPPAEVGIHPDERGGRHELYLLCEDLDSTVAALKANGVEFTAPITDQRWGRVTSLKVPGAGEIGLYEPRHPLATTRGNSAGPTTTASS
jgi:catechol 2,3-dioxygenase-like lactoylglutathione lyase family enzyme